jgi:hypothetical protein
MRLGGEASVLAERAASAIKSDVSGMVEAALAAERAARDLRERADGERREGFIALSRGVLATLSALGVDMSRVLDGSIDPAAMAAYRGGERNAFVSRLLRRGREEGAGERIRRAYEASAPFRRAADEFVAQFDRLMAEARESDVDGVVQAALATSDVGRIATLLRTALSQGQVRG